MDAKIIMFQLPNLQDFKQLRCPYFVLIFVATDHMY